MAIIAMRSSSHTADGQNIIMSDVNTELLL